MKPRVLNVLALLSLMLLVGVVAVWMRSYLPQDVWLRCIEGRLMVVACNGDKDVASCFSPDRSGGGDQSRAFYRALRSGSPVRPMNPTPPPPPAVVHRFLGIEAAAVTFFGGSPPAYRVAVIPLAYLAAPLAVLPAAWVARRVRRRGYRRCGRCGHCGYDLTGNVSGVCPECGHGT
jgi:hypothetical protein